MFVRCCDSILLHSNTSVYHSRNLEGWCERRRTIYIKGKVNNSIISFLYLYHYVKLIMCETIYLCGY